MRRHAGQISLLDDLLPWRLITPEIAIAFSGGKNELGILGLLDCLDHSDRSGADRPHGLAGLGVSKTQAAILEIDLLPPEARHLLAAASGPHHQATEFRRLAATGQTWWREQV